MRQPPEEFTTFRQLVETLHGVGEGFDLHFSLHPFGADDVAYRDSFWRGHHPASRTGCAVPMAELSSNSALAGVARLRLRSGFGRLSLVSCWRLLGDGLGRFS